jgi:hypothetical protein
MVLEAIEDWMRGWRAATSGLGGERVAQGKYAIEHVMPRKWATNWPLPANMQPEERDRSVHLLGNLTLLTSRLNSKVSHGPWSGSGAKREALQAHDVLFLNRELMKAAGDGWSEDQIHARTTRLVEILIEIWPVPPGHRGGYASERKAARRRVDLTDLMNAGLLQPGGCLYPRRKSHAHRTATLLADGQIDVDGKTYATASAAAVSVTGRPTNGWTFFLVDPATRRTLKDVLQEYVERLSVDVGEDATEDDDEDDDS